MDYKYGKINTPIGWMLIKADENTLYQIDFTEQEPTVACADTPLIIKAKQQLTEYF
jgi:hypothetical protein